jgi:arsenite methyltransferase
MTTEKKDPWAEWVLEQRHGGDPQVRQSMLPTLLQIRDVVLRSAQIAQGETVLDIGSGDGLIAFGALPLVGTSGKVIFCDISAPLLQHCQKLAQQMGVLERCEFLHTSAENLQCIETSTIDVVTMRSVLIYIRDRSRVLQEFYRVLKPGGRLSLFEPIHSFTRLEAPHLFYGYDVTPILPIMQKLLAAYAQIHPAQTEVMMSLTEQNLFKVVEEAGFAEVYMEVQIALMPGRKNSNPDQPGPNGPTWDTFLQTAPHPFAPPLANMLDKVLTADEVERFTAYMRPLVKSNQRVDKWEIAALRAVKAA